LLKHPTLDQLHALGLQGMAKAFVEIAGGGEADGLGHHEWLALLLDREASWRRDKRLTARLRVAKLRQQACVEDIDYRSPRGLDRALFQKLVEGEWIDAHDNLALIGPTGVGKSWLASALGHKACRDNRSVLYQRAPRLFEDLALARGDGRHPRILRNLGRADLLILDDWGLEPLDAAARHDLLEILEERYSRRSTVITSQLPVDRWHQVIGDPINAEYPHCRWTGVRSADYLSAPWAFWPSASDRGAEIRTRPKVRHGAVARWPQTIDSTIDHESGGGTFYAG
jgi:DNA replication protein DnaC